MPLSGVEELENWYTDWLKSTLQNYSGVIDARLKKRYKVPFDGPPYPEQVVNWLVRLVDPRAYLKRGVDVNDAQLTKLVDDSTVALAEIKEAADSENGLYDLPLLITPNAEGIIKPKILSTSDANAYSWMRRQAERSFNG